MSRIGKIARLPHAVREELNRRLLDGEPANGLVEWLNGREDVQAALKAHCDGRPINDPNLTQWMRGGFEDWRRQEEAKEMAERFVADANDVRALTEGRTLVDRTADTVALAILQELMVTRRMEDGVEKREAVLKIVQAMVRLRKAEREDERSQREAADEKSDSE